MAIPTASDPAKRGGERLARLARAEGSLALFFVAAVLLFPWLPPLPQAPGLMVFDSIWACAWLFAISGARRGRGKARVAAIVGLVVLVLHVAFVMIVTRL